MSLAELQLGLPGQLDLRGIVWLPPHVEPLLPSRADRIAAHAAVGRAALDWARDAAAANPRAARAATAAMAAAAMAVAGREMYYTMWPPPRPPDSTATLPDEVLADILAMLDERSALAAAMVNPRWRRVCRLLVTVSVTPGLFGSPHFWGLGRLGKQPPDKLSAAEADARLLSFTSQFRDLARANFNGTAITISSFRTIISPLAYPLRLARNAGVGATRRGDGDSSSALSLGHPPLSPATSSPHASRGLVWEHEPSRLTALNLWKVTGVTDEWLALIGTSCPRLVKLKLGGCTNVTLGGLEALASGLPELLWLEICTDAYTVTDAWLDLIAARWSKLIALNLMNCRLVTDNGLASIAAGCPELRVLRIDGCHEITPTGLYEVALQCPRLSRVSATSCTAADSVVAMFLRSRGCEVIQ